MNPLFDHLFVFEMANNHQGSVEHGCSIIREMAKVAHATGIKAAVKFQYRDLDTFLHPDHRDARSSKHIPRFLQTRIDRAGFKQMAACVKDSGLLLMVTFFDEVSVACCIDDHVDILKLASCSASDWPLIETIAAAGRPLVVSTGGLDMPGIDRLVSFLGHRKAEFAVMHCIGQYPTPPEALHLRFLRRLSARYPGIPIGYSGHEAPNNTEVVQIAVAQGARLFERHVGLPTDTITLNNYSMNPQQTHAWVEAARRAQIMCGIGDEKPIDVVEVESLRSLARGVFARHAINMGATIRRDDVFFAMPIISDDQTTSGDFGRYRAVYMASRDYAAGEAVCEAGVTSDIDRIRDVVHAAKGMLSEANISLGTDVEIELSHHYGIDRFYQTGCVLVSEVNRDYCKKVVVVFPGQQHPAHAHRRKEETFQVLSGELEVCLEGVTHRLSPGDKLLVEPESMHSFGSTGGAIFEEVSTTHRRGDSYYADAALNRLDPLERKTLVQNW